MPHVLLLYYTYTQQTRRVAEAMSDVLRDRGCEVRLAAIEFTDKRWAERFTRFPLRRAYLDVLGMSPAQLRGATGEIQIPDDAREGDYDLVCIGSPTWFFRPSVPIRSYLKSEAAGRLLDGKRFTAFVVCRRYWRTNLKSVRKLGTEQGGEYVDGVHFTFERTPPVVSAVRKEPQMSSDQKDVLIAVYGRLNETSSPTAVPALE